MSKTINNVLFATFGVLLAQVVGSLRSFVLAKLISPADYGIWTGAQTVASLAPIACLGTVEALLKRVPYFRGKGDQEGLRKVQDGVFGTITIGALVFAAVFIVFGGILPIQFIKENLLIVQLTAASAAIGFFSAFYYHRCTAFENFKGVSAIDTLRSLVSTACILILAFQWGLLGGVIGFFVGEVLTWILSAWISRRSQGSVGICFKPAVMADAVRVGFPITIVWWVYVIHANVGRITSLSYLGNTATGYYGVGGSLATLFALIPNTIGRVFYPRVNAQIGGNASLSELKKSVILPTTAIALSLPAAQIVLFYVLPIVYHEFLPKYSPGLACAQILLFGAFFVGLIRNGANYLIAIDKQALLMKYVVLSLIVNAAGSVAFTRWGWGINGIAIAASLGSGLLASLIWKQVFAEFGYEFRDRFVQMLDFYTPLAGAALAVIAVELLFGDSRRQSLFLLPCRAVLALCLWAGVVFLRTGTRRMAIEMYRRSFEVLESRFGRVKPKVQKGAVSL